MMKKYRGRRSNSGRDDHCSRRRHLMIVPSDGWRCNHACLQSIPLILRDEIEELPRFRREYTHVNGFLSCGDGGYDDDFLHV